MDKSIKILGLTFNPRHTFTKHIQNTTEKATNTTKILKVLTTTHWGKSKETLLSTYTAITRTTLEYRSTIWSLIISDTNTNKLQSVLNTALLITTGCMQDTSIQHLHEQTSILPIKQHLALHASQLRQKAQHTEHTLHQLTLQPHQSRNMKQTIFHNTNYTTNRDTIPDTTTLQTVKNNMKLVHTEIVQSHLQTWTKNKVINDILPKINAQGQTLPRYTRRTLSQLTAKKCLLLINIFAKFHQTHIQHQCVYSVMHTHT